jgi:hypothetical protein
MRRLGRPVSRSVDAVLGEPLVASAELQHVPGVEQEGRQVPFEEGAGGAAGRGRGQQRLAVAEG